ncbi:MAG TPA: hypothetical protein VGC56_01490 [Allosphingosinicella sp.]|jgi:hypothetical protein
MSRKDRIRLHAHRAMEELDRARAAVSPEAAIAHLGLSELHLGEMKTLSDAPAPNLQLVRAREKSVPDSVFSFDR